MVQLCTKCSRANPPEAVYCYHDGVVLAGHEGRGPMAMGARAFNSPFVFPSGKTCNTFDELGLACQQDWATAVGLLRDGYLESFFKGLGRVDLTRAAGEAAKFPDPDRGLDQLLSKLPTSALGEPQLNVAPQEVNLGLIEEQERTFDLELENQGSRLLYGTVTCPDAIWLTLGEGQGSTEKHFHCTHETRIPVKVVPERIRASSKPIEARLSVASNGGTVEVIIRCEKPVRAFPDGLLKGAKTPRQIAEKAMQNAKEVAPLFETGQVEKWYRSNGWVYPVKIPAAEGLAAIQQFFEALGFTKPPKVAISHTEINLSGKPGESLDPEVIKVSTEDKRPVFAHVTSNVPWLEVSRPKFAGKSVSVRMSVSSVPNKPGETLEGELTVISNGSQKFLVPVRLEVAGKRLREPVREPDDQDGAFDFSSQPPPPPVREAPREERNRDPEPPRKPKHSDRKKQGVPLWLHLVPAVFLGLALVAVAGWDYMAGKKGGGEATGQELWNYNPKTLRDAKPRIRFDFDSATNRFGLVQFDARDPDNKDAAKKLTAEADGRTNNTIVKIDGHEYLFGKVTPTNKYVTRHKDLPSPRLGFISSMRFGQEKVVVTQHVEIVPGQSGLLDTCLVYYRAYNEGTLPRKVGVRFMLDTYIGNNDGVPFTVPGEEGFVTTQKEFKGDNVPESLEVIEKPDDSKDPGTVARLWLRGLNPGKLELTEPERVVICGFESADIGWDWTPKRHIRTKDDKPDSCVLIFWPYEDLEPRASRHMAITYGLGKLAIGDLLAISAKEIVAVDYSFTVTAYVFKAKEGQKVEIELPEGMKLVGGEAEKTIKANKERDQVSWRVKATKKGTFTIKVRSGKTTTEHTVEAKPTGVFG